ncbi:MAG: benzoyl-CoA 2,3-epoxidase subunit BoxA [Hyphomicrobiaceae bacterium]
MTHTATGALHKQHLIDPEICIRCGTCEATCTVGAVTHDDQNYVVDAEKCNACLDCIAPCPTGSIDNWRIVSSPYSVDEQLSWLELPAQADLGAAADNVEEASDHEAGALIEAAHAGAGGRVAAPASARRPVVNLYGRSNPAIATVQGNFRITAASAESDVRHIVLGFGETAFPVLEGQSIGVLPPVSDPDGRPYPMRLYSVASARDGEKRNANNIALTVKRVESGLVSEWLCNLKVGARIAVVGPFGSTFLMPDDPKANILMICTGTGSAPFRAFTERRRRAAPTGEGRLIMFFGARTPEELPYFGPLQKVPSSLLEQHLVYSRLSGVGKEYVQDRMRAQAARLAPLLSDSATHIYICGLKGMEEGVDAALAEIAQGANLDWASVKPRMRSEGRYHVETY